ncbi:MAG TPA: insulinase family protein [Phycisphaerae bacterium]|nr:insulinase family protein [Phycisphaerae bacterium]
MRRLSIVLVTATLLTGCADADPPPQPPETFTLDNGLTVMLRPMQGTEKVALVVLYAVGGLHDPKGQSGLAHLIEHCYVTAAAGSTPQRDMQGFMARYPDGWNAQTGDDYTVIAGVFKREALGRELADAAARMNHLHVLDSDLDREKPRIFAELRNMYAAMPHLAARNLAREKVCPSPHDGRKGGLADHVNTLQIATVQQRIERYYKATNATLVLAGAFDAAAARAAIAKHFGDIPPGDAIAKPPDRPKPKLPAAETVRVRSPLPQAGPVVGLAYAAPKTDSDLYAPFLVLVGRLWHRAQALGAAPGGMPIHFAALDDPAVVSVCAPMKDGEEPDQAVARLEAFVAEAAKAELATSDRMVTLQTFNFAFGLLSVPDQMLAQNLYGVAFGMGRRAQMGVDSAALKGSIETVTTDDLRRAAEAVFSEKVRAAVVVIPQ